MRNERVKCFSIRQENFRAMADQAGHTETLSRKERLNLLISYKPGLRVFFAPFAALRETAFPVYPG
jgi:hypothetical protein